jgi:hypothetical protein
MEVVTGPIGNGIQGITEVNPFAGVLFGGMLVIIVVLWRALSEERKARLADKEKALEDARQDKEFYEKLVERAETSGANKRRAT